jgi:hypothetical protein
MSMMKSSMTKDGSSRVSWLSLSQDLHHGTSSTVHHEIHDLRSHNQLQANLIEHH